MTAPQDPFAAPDDNAPPAPYGQTPGPTQTQYGQTQQSGYAQPGYGQPPPYGTMATGPRNGLGTAALVCGILAVVFFWTVIGGVLLGIVAIVLGALGRGRAKRHEANNGGIALAGLILGVIGCVLSLAIVAFGLSVLNSHSGKTLRSCLRDAGSNAAAQQACTDKFQQDFNR